ncbi:MAG: aspartate--tRNA ligase [Tenuifilum sp.]|uniref:aspartate--tRNA ligase n=3 Tax=Tenuifilum sp. TaxID=2760880 RepID=UPI001B467B1B|nr:aspartate--tRNA ligase [Bacteroidales bacterium]HRU87243.1 aspartate--tRNA ligase [Tenuifilum sp.]
MYRSHTCGELRIAHVGSNVTLSGWVQRIRNLGAMTFIDLRDRYGITQVVVDDSSSSDVKEVVKELGREYVIQISGEVVERASKNSKLPTGDIEVKAKIVKILNTSEIPPFTIEDETDGGDELRMKYRYLDLRRNPVKNALLLRHRMAQEVRKYLDAQGFIEVETPFLIKSTPEGARDFVVPSRMHPGEFYALPQSPQTFKQLLMVAGFDKYFQIVKCFRDEDLRADRQPEFTQIDCEMSFVERDDVLNTFEGLIKHLFAHVKGINFDESFRRMPYSEAMEKYGSDKPDLRFGMEFVELSSIVKGKGFKVFDDAEYIGGICATGCAGYTRKQLDELTEFVKRPQVGASGLVYIRFADDGIKSTVDKFYSPDDLMAIANVMGAKQGDLILVLAGSKKKTLSALCELRLEMGNRLGLRSKDVFAPLWVVDFPLLEWDDEAQRFFAMHHPFTSPNPDDTHLFKTDPAKIRANAYDLVINGVEIGGGSIRIYNRELQQIMFDTLGFTNEEAEKQFGFLLNAFRYGAPPHGGIAFGFDRLCSLFGGSDSIRDYIAFPKNNAGRDVMIDSPSTISQQQLDELSIQIKKNN